MFHVEHSSTFGLHCARKFYTPPSPGRLRLRTGAPPGWIALRLRVLHTPLPTPLPHPHSDRRPCQCVPRWVRHAPRRTKPLLLQGTGGFRRGACQCASATPARASLAGEFLTQHLSLLRLRVFAQRSRALVDIS